MAARVAVVGAGIAGLTCAHRLARLAPAAEVVVLEASGRTGGKVLTTDFAGRPIDEAVDGFLARIPATVALCRELGLGGELTAPATGRAWVWRGGEMHALPDGLVLGVPTDLDALAASGIVSPAGVARAERDLRAPADAPAPGVDESVGALVRRRLGDEVFEALVSPLLSGVNAGDADELSVQAGAPQLAAARDQGPASLIEALRRQRAAAEAVTATGTPVFYGLVGGTQRLTDALAAALGDGVRTGCTVRRLREPGASDGTPGGRFRLDIATAGGDEQLDADAVVLAVPSYAAAPLVEPLSPELAAGLSGLAWASVALVTLAVPRVAITRPVEGSGFLVAPGEPPRPDGGDELLLTACSFGSSKWAHWAADDDLVILRVSAGRHPADRRALDLDDEALVARLTSELATTIGLGGEPVAARVSRWERALPQYRAGHLDRARRWKDLARAQRGLFLTGASYFGLGLPACVTDAEATAVEASGYLTRRSS